MRRLLLDTHVLLWWLAGDPRIGPVAARLIRDGTNAVFVFAASAWEMSIEKGQGKLRTPHEELGIAIAEEGFLPLPITVRHGERAGELPLLHRDPFDRMLVAQAQEEGLEVVTSDPAISKYGVPTVDAAA
ncbi:MAG: type II toxin-antitoxin system VapC family toxin [Deferrisomatales bacterium]|nr:type II toxin-antitoxin system VapC family toxin [Deferrisomatales bacterium]